MKLTDKEINAILSKSQDVRYSYSLKRIADNDCLWILTTNKGWTFYQYSGRRTEYASYLAFSRICRKLYLGFI